MRTCTGVSSPGLGGMSTLVSDSGSHTQVQDRISGDSFFTSDRIVTFYRYWFYEVAELRNSRGNR